MRIRLFLTLILFLTSVNTTTAQTTAFTYQGKLTDGANPATGNYDLQFKLFDTVTVGTGTQQGNTVTVSNVIVTNGIFTVQLDFGAAAFSGLPRFLEIGVRSAGSPDPYTLLTPRQAVTSAPYALRSLNASVADVLSSACRGCVTSTQVGSVAGSTVTGQIPVASVPAGSASYVQNTTSQQAASNFNISGDGTAGGTLSANAITAATQFNISGNRVLALAQVAGIFVGRLAGFSNTTGSGNTFVGESAGRFNTTGFNNSFFGSTAGTVNTASNNSFFGAFSGSSNTTGTRNSFFGSSAGDANDVGNDNAFFGYRAGRVNTASFNSFFGSGAGDSNTMGTNNAFFGYSAGAGNLTGVGNSFFGSGAGQVNTAGSNSFFGFHAGFANTTGANNAFFGDNAGLNNTESFNSFFGSGAGSSNTTGCCNSFFGFHSGQNNSTGQDNAFFARNAGLNNSGGDNNAFFGLNAGSGNTLGSNNTAIGANTVVGNIATFATAIGAGAVATTGNTVVLGRSLDTVKISGGLDVTGVLNVTGILNVTDHATIDGFLDVNNNASFVGIDVSPGGIKVSSLGSSGSEDLCRNGFRQISTCSSSLRYKSNVETFFGGLDIVRRLRPITFNWKGGGMRDLGFAAEAVEQVEPLLTTYNDIGEVEGVKYKQLTTVLVNAVKEQQTQIELLRQQNKLLQEQLSLQQQQTEALKRLVCQQNSQAEVCQYQKGGQLR